MKTFVSLLLLITLNICMAADGTIVRFKGKVLIDGKMLGPNKDVNVGQVVEVVGKGSFCQIKLKNGSSFLIKNGAMKIAKNSESSSTLSLIKGTLFNAVNKARTKDFLIKTKNASMAVRGTKFFVEATDEETYLCVCEGVVEISNDKEKKNITKFEDTHVKMGSSIESHRAPKVMWKMAREGFALMGIDVGFMN